MPPNSREVRKALNTIASSDRTWSSDMPEMAQHLAGQGMVEIHPSGRLLLTKKGIKASVGEPPEERSAPKRATSIAKKTPAKKAAPRKPAARKK